MNEDLGSPGRRITVVHDNSEYPYECERCLKGFQDELSMRWVDTKEYIKRRVITEYRVFYEDHNKTEYIDTEIKSYHQKRRIMVCVGCMKNTDTPVWGMTREQRRMARLGSRR